VGLTWRFDPFLVLCELVELDGQGEGFGASCREGFGAVNVGVVVMGRVAVCVCGLVSLS